jgi:D-beta-D-heptose 7-phosphate kinase/D-beta-D-heptose 1-phosphate adenosyltransferase
MKIWVNGTFDVIHRGHIELLTAASEYGELIVGIDTDERVRQLKGSSRPLHSLQDRSYIISKIKGVSKVVSFATDQELINHIKDIQPDYMMVGSDYIDKNVIGSEHAKELIYFKRIEGYSSTKIMNYE